MKEKLLYWIPRIFTILALMFMLMFSFDAFEGEGSVAHKLASFFMNNLPFLILTLILIIAWNRELWGGILFIGAFIAATVFFKSFSGNPGSLIIIIPFLITGVLFILHHLLYGKQDKNVSKPPYV